MCGFSRVKGLNGACGNEAVDSQHGAGVGESSHTCTKGYYPSKRFSYSDHHTLEYISRIRILNKNLTIIEQYCLRIES
jgi:hypothetical protein